MRKLAWLLILTAALPVRGENPDVEQLLREGDAYQRQFDAQRALEAFHRAEKVDPANSAILLRLSKQYGDMVSAAKPAAAKKLATLALTYARRAEQADPKIAQAHLCLAISYGKLTDFADNRTKLRYAKLVREEALKAITLDPTDDNAYHVLGRWHHGVANINAALRALAKVIYGGLPPASNEEAVRLLTKAAELAPHRIIHHSELARVYSAMGKKDLAAREWKIVLALPPQNREDEKDRKEATAALRGH